MATNRMVRMSPRDILLNNLIGRTVSFERKESEVTNVTVSSRQKAFELHLKDGRKQTVSLEETFSLEDVFED